MTMPQLEQELDDYLEQVEDPTGGYPLDSGERPWTITDDSAADWCLRKLARVRARRAEVDMLLADRMEHLRRWHENAIAPLDKDEDHWTGLLAEYALWRRNETGAASVKLPNGELTTRLTDRGGAVEVTDAKALLAWLDDHPDLLEQWCKLEAVPQVSRLKKDVVITASGPTYEGEFVPGLGVRPETIQAQARC
jgi:hypothetical protein